MCILSNKNKVTSNRSKLLDVIRQFPENTLIAMEACGCSNYWARTIERMGFSIRLIPPQHVKPFVGHQKNDANDARAICEAALRPNLHNVPIKTIELQDIKSISSELETLCKQQPRYQALLAIPGFGSIITAAFLSQVGTGKQFSNGRQLSAWCGLVPRQASSGGKPKLGRITKNGNNELRALLIHGARSVSKYTQPLVQCTCYT